jgi:ADP-ribose pyrophosphatase
MIPKYKVITSQTLFDHPKALIMVDTLEYLDKDQLSRTKPQFYLVSPVEAVSTLAVTDTGLLVLTRQYRHPIGQVIYDLPGGRLEPGEDPLEGARREFEEETGLFPNKMTRLGYYNQFPGTLRAATHLFFASDLESTQQRLDESEELEIVYLPVTKVVDMILDGETIDGSLQLAVLLARQKGLI